MLSLDHITMQFGGRYLFSDASFMIGPHDRTGLVGSNGAGKSTLLRIIAGQQTAEEGTISKAKYVTVGYLPQDGITAAGNTLYKEVETAFEDVLLVQEELEESHAQLATLDPESPEYMDTLEVYGELQHKLEGLDAFRMKSKIEQVLLGLGFAMSDMGRLTQEFSGGWQMRIELAKLLLREPSVLLLDEPTNHLDIESLQWLEEYLHQYNGAIMLVSHDRAFLDSLCTKTFAVTNGAIEEYSGNYSFYERERLVRKELLLNAYRNQQQQLKQTEEFIERFRYKATKARQVQSRIKQMEKIDLIEIEDEEEEISFSFPPPISSGRVVLQFKGMSKRYGALSVFDTVDYTIERGDKIAIVGVNGAGKSTFARMLAGVEPLSGGERIVGHNVILSYFAQHQAEELDMSKEVLDIVDEVATGDIRTRLRTLLGCFLFKGDDVFKKVRVLSGGEKSRLALAKMLLQPSNVLIMDEPTNHLDMRSKQVLQKALAKFEGTFLIVSHDRAFLDPLVTKVIDVAHGTITTTLGNVTDYLKRKKNPIPVAADNHTAQGATAPIVVMSDKERRRAEAERRQQLSKVVQPLRKKLHTLEKEIERFEIRKKEIETQMGHADFYKNGVIVKQISDEYKELQTRMDTLAAEWTETSDRLASASR
ncbi:MAG: ABC-F family ATP-binding cassette domain-containing protein [Ignavibacteriales bacterium]|nr:ABC-F family ATP-binding cassette domain-containing protein [Ignavibacteriales bacterium]